MITLRMARQAMATRFEFILQGTDEVRLRAAGEEALAEIGRLEAQLSFYRPTSEISRINARAAAGPVPIEPRLFRLLQTAQRLYAATGGAFDPTVAPLMRCWGFAGGTGCLPAAEALAEARSRTGMHLVVLDEAHYTVSFARSGVMLDLGAIGKGYAIDEAAQILREAGVERAFLHGGTSTIAAVGRPFDGDRWNVALAYPHGSPSSGDGGPVQEELLTVVPLENEALSVSAVWGKAFQAGGKTYGHVLDPRSGEPVAGAVLTAVLLPSATESDALATALLVLGHEGHNLITRYRTTARTFVLCSAGETVELVEKGPPGAASRAGRAPFILHPAVQPQYNDHV